MPNFRMGRLRACPYFLEAVPRPAMVAAIRVHAAAEPTDGPIVTTHRHQGRAFVLVTDAKRSTTAIKLA